MVEKYLDPGIKDRWQARGRQSARSSQSSQRGGEGRISGWTDDRLGEEGPRIIDNEAERGGAEGRG